MATMAVVEERAPRGARRLTDEERSDLLARAEAAHKILRRNPDMDGLAMLTAVVCPSPYMRQLFDTMREEENGD